jgi:hypothetical protein
MRHPRQIERWRRMTPSERFDEFIALMEFNHRLHMSLPPEERARRDRLLRERHDADEGHTARVPGRRKPGTSSER